MKNNEKGMTLVEVLATLVITSLFMGIIYSVVMMVMEYNSVETTKTRLQQEANYIITELQQIHRKGDCYLLSITESKVAVAENCKNPNMEVLSSGFVYDTAIDYHNAQIDPNNNDIDLSNFSIQYSENKNLKIEVSTMITRYKNIQ